MAVDRHQDEGHGVSGILSLVKGIIIHQIEDVCQHFNETTDRLSLSFRSQIQS